jgi:intracellular septation protein
VSFKLFGVMPLTMIFGLAQIPVLTKHAPPKRDDTAQAAD